jgi:hypothetical protein
MSRGLSANNLAASQAAHVRPLVFVKLEFDGGTEYLHNGVGTYTTLGQTWTGIGKLGEIAPIEESLALSPYAVSMRLTALDADLLEIAVSASGSIFNRSATIYVGLLDDNGQLVDDPIERWSGTMDSMPIALGEENIITLNCENDFRFFEQANGSRFTSEDQQRAYAGDLFFEFLDQMIDKQVNWGVGSSPIKPGGALGVAAPGGRAGFTKVPPGGGRGGVWRP